MKNSNVSTALNHPSRKIAFLATLIALWYLFSYLFNSNLKSFFKLHEATSNTLYPLLFSIFLGNTAATGLWVVQSGGWRGCDVLGGSCLYQLIFSHKLDFTLLCSSGVVGVAATCLVLQYGSIQLVQIARSLGPVFTTAWAYLVLDQVIYMATISWSVSVLPCKDC